MPIYEYACSSCGSVIEVMQKMSDRPLRKCRKCSGRLQKLISRTSFQLKGGGWYAQGYSNSSGAGNGSKTEGKKSREKKSESKKSDSKASGGGKADASSVAATA